MTSNRLAICSALGACVLALASSGCKKSGEPEAKVEPAPSPAKAGSATQTTPASGGAGTVQKLFATNLLANGDAEVVDDASPVPGWAAAPDSVGWESDDYGHTSGEFDADHPPFSGAGKRYFRCSVSGERHCRSVQHVALDPLAADVDQGKLTVELSGWFGSFGENDSSGVLEVRFLDASGKELGKLATDPSKSAERAKPASGEAAVSRKAKSGPVPTGARSLEIVLRDGGINDAHADAYFADALEVRLGRK